MPKKLNLPGNVFAYDEHRRFVEVAEKAVGKVPGNRVLTPDDVEFLAEIGSNPISLVRLVIKNKGESRNQAFSRATIDDVCENYATRLSYLMARAPEETCAAISAARKEAARIQGTAEWWIRKVIRDLAFERRCGEYVPQDMQVIKERVKAQSGFAVEDKLVHKAIRRERNVQAPKARPLDPQLEERLARGARLFGSLPKKPGR